MIRDLGLDQPPVDPTTLTGEEMVKEVQRVVKALLGYGARMPKELMLYVKNMVFLDGAIARLAPDLDILAEIASISMMFAERHGERLGTELGIDPTQRDDRHRRRQGRLRRRRRRPTALTYRDLQARRKLIQQADARRRARDRARPSCASSSPAARVDYQGRLDGPPARGGAADHGQGRRLRGDPQPTAARTSRSTG